MRSNISVNPDAKARRSLQTLAVTTYAMDNPYLSYIQEDPKLNEAVSAVLPELERLSSTQIEKLVFYLKSLHSYYPKSENHTSYGSEFADKLDKLRNNPEQLRYQSQTGSALLKGIVCCLLGGVLLAMALAALVGGQTGIGIGFLAVTGVCVFLADTKFFRKAVLTSKEQDRKYFLSSIRAANACNELDWAGLFSYSKASKSGPLSDEDEVLLAAQVAELAEKLRAALYNDEYFQYSSKKLKAAEPGDS